MWKLVLIVVAALRVEPHTSLPANTSGIFFLAAQTFPSWRTCAVIAKGLNDQLLMDNQVRKGYFCVEVDNMEDNPDD
jgi:hypothetical protein